MPPSEDPRLKKGTGWDIYELLTHVVQIVHFSVKAPAAFHGSHLSAVVPALWIVVVEQVETPTAAQAEFYWKPSEVMLITVVPDTQEDAISDYISSTSSFFFYHSSPPSFETRNRNGET